MVAPSTASVGDDAMRVTRSPAIEVSTSAASCERSNTTTSSMSGCSLRATSRCLRPWCQRRTTLRQAPAWAVDNETASAGDSETAITRSACAARRRRLRSCAGHGPYRTCRIADDLLRLARRGIGTLQLRADGAASSKRASMRAAENERSKVKVENLQRRKKTSIRVNRKKKILLHQLILTKSTMWS